VEHVQGDVKMKRQQAGMTLIELVIVIIVLGIIAAVAAPKFADISGTAAISAQDGSRGAVLSAYTISVAVDQGTPTWTTYISKIGQMTCGASNGICTTDDFDSDTAAKGDLEFKFYSSATCGAAITAGTDTIFSYREGAVNTAVAGTETCVDMN